MFLRIGRRLLRAFAILVAVVVVSFVLIHVAPGDPATVMAGSSGASDPEIMADLRQQFGLDQPIPVQLGIYLRNIASLDFEVEMERGGGAAALRG